MFAQILNNPRPFGPLEIIFLSVFCVVVGSILTYLLLRERLRLAAPSVAVGEQVAAAEPTGGFKLRKAAPYLALVGALVLFVLLRPAVQALLLTAAPVVAPDATNVEGAQVVADQMSGGYVQFGTVVSKIVVIVLLYAIGSFLPWLFQQLTHPAPTRWKKHMYSAAFDDSTDQEKFIITGRIDTNAAIRWAAVVIGACLIS